MRTLSIIILHHNAPEQTERCLQSLKNALLPEKTEIIIVNNGGHEANKGISQKSHKSLDVKFFDIPNSGYAQGNNFGLHHCSGKYLAFINPDIVVERNTIAVLLDYLNAHPNVGIAAPKLVYPDGSIQDNYRNFPRLIDLIIKRTKFLRKIFLKRMRHYLMWNKNPNTNEAVDWVTGAFQIIKRDCLNAIGAHDERYFLFMSDVSLCRTAWERGYEVHYVGDAKAAHNDERLSSGGFFILLRKKVLRIHLLDALKYYLYNFSRRMPKTIPSLKALRKTGNKKYHGKR